MYIYYIIIPYGLDIDEHTFSTVQTAKLYILHHYLRPVIFYCNLINGKQ